MKIAIISGASAGLGKKLLEKSIPAFPEIEEYWLISRSIEKLEETAAVYPTKKFKLLALDLCSDESFSELADKPTLDLFRYAEAFALETITLPSVIALFPVSKTPA